MSTSFARIIIWLKSDFKMLLIVGFIFLNSASSFGYEDEFPKTYTKAEISKLKLKMQSKECRIYKIYVDLCNKVSVEEVADEALKMENSITKSSGIINKTSRYEIGRTRAMHGTAEVPALKKKYKKLSGKDWNRKSCDEESTQDETSLCGCKMDFNSEDLCPQEVMN